MSKEVINKQYLDSLLQEAINQEAEYIVTQLAERAKKGYNYVCICTGKRHILDEHVSKVVQALKLRNISPAASDDHYKFSCDCQLEEGDERCHYGKVFFF